MRLLGGFLGQPIEVVDIGHRRQVEPVDFGIAALDQEPFVGRMGPGAAPQTELGGGQIVAVIGPSGSGKGVLLQRLILDIYKDVFARIYLMSPSIHVDRTWEPVKKYI